MDWASGDGVSPSLAKHGEAVHGRTWQGVAWPSAALAATAALGASAPSAALIRSRYGFYWTGTARRCGAKQGNARNGAAPADLSTEPYGALCWVLRNPDVERHGPARLLRALHVRALHVRAGCGAARRGSAKLISARRVNRLSLLGSLNPDMARQGWVR